MYRRDILNDNSIQTSDLTATKNLTTDNATFTGQVSGFTTVSDGSSVFTYAPETRTFYITTPQGSVTPGMLVQVAVTNDEDGMNNGEGNKWQTVGGDCRLDGDGVFTVKPLVIDNS